MKKCRILCLDKLSERQPLHLLLLCSILLFIASRLVSGNTYTNWDEELYLIIAKGWTQGLLPYRDIFDHKPPLVYLLYAIFSFGGKAMWLVRTTVTGIFVYVLFAAALSFADTLKSKYPERLIFIATFLAALSMRGGMTTNTESLYIPAILFSFIQLQKKQTIKASIAGAIALSIKYTTILDLTGVAIAYAALHQDRTAFKSSVQFLFWSGVFAALQYLLFGTYFYFKGVNLFNQIVWINLSHACDRLPLWSPRLLFSMRFVVYLSATVFAAWLLSNRKAGSLAFSIGLASWGALTIVQAILTGQYYGHYFLPFAIPATIALTSIKLSQHAIRIFAVSLLTLGLWTFWTSTMNAYWFSKKSSAVKHYCQHVQSGYYVSDDMSIYRICDATKFDKFVFPPFYLRTHFAELSDSGGVVTLRNKIENGTIPGIICNPDLTKLPPELQFLSYPSLISIQLPSQ